MYDVVIIGGGPAGVAAGIYAARKKMRSVLVTDTFGGQSVVSDEIGNWIGEIKISGFELARKLEAQVRAYPEVEIDDGDLADRIEPAGGDGAARFAVTTRNGKRFETKTVLVASGSSRKKLGIPGEKEYEGRGVSYCSICDAVLFSGKDVAVVGGGNSALEATLDLIPYARAVTLLTMENFLRGDPVTQERIRGNSKVNVLLESAPVEIFGDGKFVRGLRYKNIGSGREETLAAEGVFVEIGSEPNSGIARGIVSVNERGEVVVDPRTQRTSVAGIWAAGDVTDGLYRQNSIAVGDAVKAILNIYDYLQR